MPDPLIVTLRPFEIEMAATVGVQRHVRALALGKRPSDGVPVDRLWQIHVEGALGELAFAKATGRYWGGSVGTYRRGGDVGQIQVRTTTADRGHLLLYTTAGKDHPSDAFVLVTAGNIPVRNISGTSECGLLFAIRGWCYAYEGKLPRYLRRMGEGRPAQYWVPQSDLRDARQLIADTAVADSDELAV